MNRLTQHSRDGWGFTGMPKIALDLDSRECKIYEKAATRLAQYEATGLEPDEIPHWIPVSERLPMEAECVLVWGIYGFAKCAMVGCLQEGRWLLEGPFDDATVTHWMPLPAAPKEEE